MIATSDMSTGSGLFFIGFIFGSSKDIDCLLVRTDGVAEHYAGSIDRYGVDIGFTKEANIVWLVFAPGAIGATPAVQSAVCDALAHLGVRHVDIPCTPERVWRAIGDAKARQ